MIFRELKNSSPGWVIATLLGIIGGVIIGKSRIFRKSECHSDNSGRLSDASITTNGEINESRSTMEATAESQSKAQDLALLALRATRQQVIIGLIALEVAWLLGPGEWNPWALPVGILTFLLLLSIPAAPVSTQLEDLSLGLGGAGAIVIATAWFLDPYFEDWSPTIAPYLRTILDYLSITYLPSDEEVHQLLFVAAWVSYLPLSIWLISRFESAWNRTRPKANS